jgi:hypothetical protein
MNGKTYDVTVIKSGEESMMSAAINHIHSIERVIAVVEDINSIPKLDITVPARFCTVDPVTFYMLQDGEIVKERE